MASPELAKVNEYLRGLAAGNPGADLSANRQLVDRYGDVDPSVRVFDAEVRKVDAAGVPCEWLLAKGSDPDARLLYIHGGGWTAGGLDSHRPLSARLAAATGCAVLAVDYRLAPEHPFPAAVEDALASYRWLLAEGVEGSRIAVAGDSAGAGLALALLVSLRDAGAPLPACAALLSPFADLECRGESYAAMAALDPIVSRKMALGMAQAYVGDGDASHPLASPVRAELAGLPPLLIQVGDREAVLDDARAIERSARKAGVPVRLDRWSGVVHAWHLFASALDEGRRALEELGSFVRQQTKE